MPKVHHARLDIFKALARVELHGKRQAARELGIDVRTLERWHRKHRAPLTDWEFQRELSRLETLATYVDGRARMPVCDMGIAGRNIRVEELIARREQRRSEESEQPTGPTIGDQLREQLDNRRIRLLRDEVDVVVGGREAGTEPSPPPGALDPATLTAIIAHYAGLTDAELTEREQSVAQRLAEREQRYRASTRPPRRPGQRLAPLTRPLRPNRRPYRPRRSQSLYRSPRSAQRPATPTIPGNGIACSERSSHGSHRAHHRGHRAHRDRIVRVGDA